MKPQSAKNKGRRLCNELRDKLLTFFDIHPNDIKVTSSGAGGKDLTFSHAAEQKFPFSVECKYQETVSIWAYNKQAEANATEGTYPLVVFRRNNSETYVCLKLENLLKILKGEDFRSLDPLP